MVYTSQQEECFAKAADAAEYFVSVLQNYNKKTKQKYIFIIFILTYSIKTVQFKNKLVKIKVKQVVIYSYVMLINQIVNDILIEWYSRKETYLRKMENG